MASLDTLLQQMSASGASGAFLRGDAPIQLQTPRGPGQLGVIANAQLERDIREIAPPDALSALAATGSAQFSYGGANFAAQLGGGVYQLSIAPAQMAYGTGIAAAPNTSGQGAGATVPPEARRWNWGAFFLPWIWGIGNGAWIGLIALIPILGFFARFLMGAKGSEWSWKKRRWNSIADFQSAQSTWGIIGAVLFVSFNVIALPIFAAILFPVFARARENARRASCQSNLKQIGLAMMQASMDNDNHFPKGTTLAQWKPQMKKYTGTSSNLFHCPSDSGSGDSYQLNAKLSNKPLENIGDPATMPVLWDKAGIRHLETRDVLFADGHVKAVREDVFQSEILPRGQ